MVDTPDVLAADVVSVAVDLLKALALAVAPGNVALLEAEAGPPCWPCYRDGFDFPNPSANEK